MESKEVQSKRRRLTGTVVSDKMQNTVVVAVFHMRKHAKYQKRYRLTSRLKADNSRDIAHSGDTVVIEETRPLSKEKCWRIVEVVTKTSNASKASEVSRVPKENEIEASK